MNRIKSHNIVVFVAILLSLSFIPTRYSRSSYQLVAAANESSDSDSDSSSSSSTSSDSDSSSDSESDSSSDSEDEEDNDDEVQIPGFIQQHKKTDPCQGIPIPPKIKSSNVEEKCKQRIVKGNHLHLLPRPGQVKAFNQANKLLLQSAVDFNPKAPRVFCNIVVKTCPKGKVAAGYAHHCTGTDDIKIGETGNIKTRQQQNHENLCKDIGYDSSDSDSDGSTTSSCVGKSICVTFTPPEDWVDNSFVDSDIIDGIKKVLHKLPMTGGIHPDNNERLINKIIRQVGELNGSCNYNIKKGVVAEWCLRSPSEKEAQLTDYRQIIRDVHPLLGRIRDIFRGNFPLSLMTILTWPKMDDALRDDKYAAISLFLHPRKESISEYLINQCVDEDKRRKFKDAYEECPYLEMITPPIKKIKELMETNPLPANLKSQLQKHIDDIESEEYQQPKRVDLAAGGIERLEEIFNDPSSKSTLIEVKRDVMTNIEEHKKDWYNDNIYPGKPSSDPCTCTADKLVLPDIKVMKVDGEAEIVPNDNAMELYRTPSCHNIMVTGSEFKMMSPNTNHLIKVNAIRGYLFKTVILLFLNLLDDKGMLRIYTQMLSTLMLTNGLKKTLTVGENDKVGSLWDVMLWVLPKYARATDGKLPGQDFLKEAFCYSVQSGAVTVVDNDEMDEFDEGTNSKRRCLPFRAVLVILHEVGVVSFNKILETMGINNARVAEKDGKYYLKIDNKVYWAHYDQVNGYGHLDTATEIGWDYINGNYSFDEGRDRLLKMNWNEDDSNWVVDEEKLEYPLQTTLLMLTVLYTDVDESNNRIRLMKSRFTTLQTKLKEGLEEDDELKQHLTTFSTSGRWNELNKFFEHIDTLDDICDDDTYIFKEKYCIPTLKHHKTVYRYFKELRTRDSISKQLLRNAMKGTKYEHLVYTEKYKKVCFEMEVARAQQKGGARASTGRARNAGSEGEQEDATTEEEYSKGDPSDSDSDSDY